MKKILLSILLMFCFTGISIAEDNVDMLTDEKGEVIFSTDGRPIHSQYVEQCRDLTSGKFVKCPKKGEENRSSVARMVRQCRDGKTGRFLKCPKD